MLAPFTWHETDGIWRSKSDEHYLVVQRSPEVEAYQWRTFASNHPIRGAVELVGSGFAYTLEFAFAAAERAAEGGEDVI